jgi:hypothetical protein
MSKNFSKNPNLNIIWLNFCGTSGRREPRLSITSLDFGAIRAEVSLLLTELYVRIISFETSLIEFKYFYELILVLFCFVFFFYFSWLTLYSREIIWYFITLTLELNITHSNPHYSYSVIKLLNINWKEYSDLL